MTAWTTHCELWLDFFVLLMGRRFVRSIPMKPTKVTLFTTNFSIRKQQSRHKNILSSIVLDTSRQPSYSRRHSTCWASPQWSTLSQHAVSGPRISAPLSPHLCTYWECTAPQIETPICTHCTTATVLLTTTQLWDALGVHRWSAERLDDTSRLLIFIPDIGTHPHGMALQRTARVPHNNLHTTAQTTI